MSSSPLAPTHTHTHTHNFQKKMGVLRRWLLTLFVLFDLLLRHSATWGPPTFFFLHRLLWSIVSCFVLAFQSHTHTRKQKKNDQDSIANDLPDNEKLAIVDLPCKWHFMNDRLTFFSFFLSFYLSFYHWKQSKQRYVLFFFFWGRSLDGEPPASDWPLICVEKKN